MADNYPSLTQSELKGMGVSNPAVGDTVYRFGQYYNVAADPISNTSTSSSSGGYSSGRGAGGSGVASIGGTDAYLGWYQQQRAAAEALAAQQRAAAEDAYNRNMGALNDAYTNRGNLLSDNYNSTLADMQKTHDQNSGVVNQNVDRSLRDAYVNMMINKRDMPQMLAAQGISGGMSESTLANIRNQYGGARGDLELSRANSLDELMLALQNNQGEASRLYNDQQASDNLNRVNQEMSLRNMLENRIYDILTDEFNNVSSLEGAYLQAMSQAAQSNASSGGRVAQSSYGVSAGNSYAPADYTQQVAQQEKLQNQILSLEDEKKLNSYQRIVNGVATAEDYAILGQ